MVDSAGTWTEALRTLAQHTTGDRPWQLHGLRGGARPFFLSRCLRDATDPALIVSPSTDQAEQLTTDLRFFLGESDSLPPFARRIHYLPGWEVAAFEDVSPTTDAVASRIEGLYHLRHSVAPIIIATAESLLQRVPPRHDFAARYTYLVEGDDIDRDTLAQQLHQWGFRHVALVEDRGEFSIRGGIVDVFPAAHPYPLRLELSGDAVDAMHEFDPVSQRLLRHQPELLILPVREFDSGSSHDRAVIRTIEARARELEVSREGRQLILDGLSTGVLFPGVEFCLPYFYARLDTVWDYCPPETRIWIDHPFEVDAALERAWTIIVRRAAERATEHRFFPPVDQLYVSPLAWHAAAAQQPVIEIEELDLLADHDVGRRLTVHSFTTRDLRTARVRHKQELGFAPVAAHVRAWCDEGYRVYFVASNEAQCQRLARLLEANHLPVATSTDTFQTVLEQPGSHLRVVLGHLGDGFRLPDERLVVVTEADVFGETRRRAVPRISASQLLKNLSELKPNDYVVHLDHGVGIYRGLRHLRIADTEGDYLHLEYADADRLYLPVDRIGVVQKYVGADGSAPALDRLGGASWERVKLKTRESVLAMAKELLDIYAARDVQSRAAYSVADPYFREFEAAFPFEETPDQKQAVEDVVTDMQRLRPMDRLICGDVGYGKTEVALRAAFIAAMEGRQVAVLVPTTVLAQQHVTTFRQRCERYPIRVEMLSRFLSPAQVQQILQGLKNGTVDIVIGTHRLLQADVEFKHLGLLVIDEEHRFGVRHKERIKELRTLVDVIALTATPIPRTLEMSLMGIRDLTVIETPPVDRLAIRTYVTRYDEDIIREAIQREWQRGGQVFFVHNRVENIHLMADHLRRLVPETRITVAHGQMRERELEQVMLRFLSREVDVLVCSAIIESGLDIPNANTIIINRADQFGLAQLYQLRGRVGRSHERAYAYLMIPGEHLISREAQKRFRVLQELDDLGGGFRLAAHDLEIRGAGNLLGKQQSGHITAVGFELYTRMMEQAVRELRGQPVSPDIEPEIQLAFPAYLPDTYIPDEHQRLTFYRRLAAVKDRSELDEVAAELRERYGPPPPLVDTFVRVMDLRRTLKNSRVVRATLREGTVTLQFHPDAAIDRDQLTALANLERGQCTLSADFQLTLHTQNHEWDSVVLEVQSVLDRIQQSFSLDGATMEGQDVISNGVS